MKTNIKFTTLAFLVIIVYFIGIAIGIIGHKMNTDSVIKELKAEQEITQEYIYDLDRSKEGLAAILERIRIVVMNTEQKIEMIRIWEGGKYASVKYKKAGN